MIATARTLYGWTFWARIGFPAALYIGALYVNRASRKRCGDTRHMDCSTFVCKRKPHAGDLHWDGRFMWDDDGPVRSITPPELQSDHAAADPQS